MLHHLFFEHVLTAQFQEAFNLPEKNQSKKKARLVWRQNVFSHMGCRGSSNTLKRKFYIVSTAPHTFNWNGYRVITHVLWRGSAAMCASSCENLRKWLTRKFSLIINRIMLIALAHRAGYLSRHKFGYPKKEPNHISVFVSSIYMIVAMCADWKTQRNYK